MYVIKDDSDGFLYSADRCRFKSDYNNDDRQYVISDATFYSHNATITIDAPILGYIGKSGRFVALSYDRS